MRDFVLMTRPHEFTYKYNEQGQPLEADVDKKLWYTMQYNAQGKLIGQVFSDGAKKVYQYVDGGIKETITYKNGKTLIRQMNDRFELIKNLANIQQTQVK